MVFFIKSKGTHLPDHRGHKELTQDKPPFLFLNPEDVYIPLIEQGTPCEVKVKVGDKVKVGQVIAERTDRFAIPIHASISGEVVSVNQRMWHASGRMVPCIHIKNDFQETKAETIKPNKTDGLSRAEIIDIVRACGVVGLGGSGFPAYVKYKTDLPIDVVIINAVECEPYITADYAQMQKHLDEMLRGAEYIRRATDANRIVIAVKAYRKSLIEKIILRAGDKVSIYPVKDVYPAGWEKYLVQRITGKNYKGLPAEAGAVVNNSGTAIAVCHAVEDNMPLVEKTVTITGTGVKDPQNVYTKIGAKVSDIIAALGGYAEELGDAYFIAGGPMTGVALKFDALVINRCLSSVVVMPKVIRELNPECLGCGKCNDVCPVFLAPIQIKEALENDDLDLLKSYKPELCMECGLCSYICPSRIELTGNVARAKKKVLGSR
ncbi:MAG: RnfABCDGE type electron transport complex subunit C [Bacilli bacterium]